MVLGTSSIRPDFSCPGLAGRVVDALLIRSTCLFCKWGFITALYLLLLGGHPSLSAQTFEKESADSITISSILVAGNRKTRPEIIERELLLHPGNRYALQDLGALLGESHRLLQNTSLFIESSVDLCAFNEDTASVCVNVRENWYIFPVIIFELADRNFNVWWRQFNLSLNRVNYGMYINHYNLTGRRDVFKVKFQRGYTQQYEVGYEMSQLPGLPQWGAGVRASYNQNHEVQYNTTNDRQQFYKEVGTCLLHRTQASVFVTFRPAQVWHHSLALGFRRVAVDSIVVTQLNPNFFGNNRTQIAHFTLAWRSSLDRLVDRPYPFRGHAVALEILNEGFSLEGRRQRLWLNTDIVWYFPTGQSHGFETSLRTRIHLLRQQIGFFDYTAMGYGGSQLRGYELYVMDGLDLMLFKAGWRFTLLSADVSIPLPKWTILDDIRVMPLQLYGSFYSDHGFVHDPYQAEGNQLRNKLLSSWGIGFDMRLYFDKLFSVMWSFNQLGDNGLFLQSRIGF